MSWGDAIFGYFGLPLMIVLVGGIVLGFPTFIVGFLIWSIMYGYSFYKFDDVHKVIKEEKK